MGAMNFGRQSPLLTLIIFCLFSTAAWGGDIHQETSVLAELSLDVSARQASAVLRGASASADCGEGEGVINLSLAAGSAQVLYSLLLSAHLGERLVTVWFDRDNNCQITQAQLVD
jgi:hypothetical protein